MLYCLKRRVGLAILIIAPASVACQPLSDGAKARFSRSFTCPSERMEVRARPDLHPRDWLVSRKPAAEIASDPDRLRMWQNEQDQQVAYEEGRYRIYEVRGCGHQTLYACARARQSYNTIWIQADCLERSYRPGMAKW